MSKNNRPAHATDSSVTGRLSDISQIKSVAYEAYGGPLMVGRFSDFVTIQSALYVLIENKIMATEDVGNVRSWTSNRPL